MGEDPLASWEDCQMWGLTKKGPAPKNWQDLWQLKCAIFCCVDYSRDGKPSASVRVVRRFSHKGKDTLDDATMCSIWCHVVRMIEHPGAFPLIEHQPQAF